MEMTFDSGIHVTILFDGWKTKNIGEFIGSVMAVIVLSFYYEVVKYWRQYLMSQNYTKPSRSFVEVSPVTGAMSNLLSRRHLAQTGLHFMQFGTGYLLMLVAMTFNVWLFLAILVGSTMGYFVFGWKRQQSSEWGDHCHN